MNEILTKEFRIRDILIFYFYFINSSKVISPPILPKQVSAPHVEIETSKMGEELLAIVNNESYADVHFQVKKFFSFFFHTLFYFIFCFSHIYRLKELYYMAIVSSLQQDQKFSKICCYYCLMTQDITIRIKKATIRMRKIKEMRLI